MTLGLSGSIVPSTLRGYTRFLLKKTSTTYSDTDIDALLNLYLHEFANEIKKSGSDIDFNMIIELINLQASTNIIAITGKVLTVKRVEIKLDGTNWRKATFFDIGQRGIASDANSIADFNTAEPFVDLYLATGEALKADIFPHPQSDVTNGFKIWKTLEITELSADDDEPTIAEAYQKYLPQGSARDFLLRQRLFQAAGEMEKEMLKTLDKAIDFYATRNEDIRYMFSGAVGTDDGE